MVPDRFSLVQFSARSSRIKQDRGLVRDFEKPFLKNGAKSLFLKKITIL